MLYFVCFIFGILLFFDYFCNDFIVDLFTENKEIVIIIIIIIIFPYHLKMQDMCDDAVRMNPRSLEFVPGNLKTEGIRNEAVRNNP